MQLTATHYSTISDKGKGFFCVHGGLMYNRQRLSDYGSFFADCEPGQSKNLKKGRHRKRQVYGKSCACTKDDHILPDNGQRPETETGHQSSFPMPAFIHRNGTCFRSLFFIVRVKWRRKNAISASSASVSASSVGICFSILILV